MKDRLASFKVQYGYADIWIADADGRPVLAPYETHAAVTPALRDAIEHASESREVAFSTIHRPTPDAPPHVDFVAPLPAYSAGRPTALLVASVRVDDFLYPLIGTWPTASGSAETLLLERDGDTARILTPLCHASDPPLSKSIDRASGSVEALAAWGASGILEGRDYRGVRVIAFAEKLEGTPWVLLAKVDRAEALAGWRSEEAAALLIIALVELTIVGGSVGLWSRWVAARRRDDAQRLAAVLETLRSRPGSTHDLLVRLLRAVMDRTGSPAGAVYRYDAERDRMRPEVRLSDSIVQPGPPDARSFDWVPTAEIGAWAEPLTTGKPLIINKDADRVLEARGHPRHHLALSTFLAVPVVVDGTPVAVAGLANRASGYDEQDAVELALVFEAAWHEVERLRALEELEALNAELEQRVQERTEELAAANEELQAQAEELAAANEELQAQAEELAAANEELLAQTEQLNAANRELEAQAEQLEEQARELEQRTHELAEANEAKTRFLRTMSHELRTPLNSIIGFTELLLQGLAGPLNDEQHKQLSMVNASGHHLLTLVNDLLDLSRIEAGAVVFSREPIDVAELVREATETVRPAAEAKGLAIACEIAEPAPPLTSDATRVRQVLLNLLTNAVKFTDTGSVSVIVSRDGHRTVSFTVKDTGPGIPKERLGDIFQDFVRLQDGGAREGTGLGLAIAKQLACALGGSLTVKSTVGKGSAFTLTLPQE